MIKINYNNVLNKLFQIIFAISGMILSMNLIVGNPTVEIVIFTGIVSFICSLYLYKKTEKYVFDKIKENIIFAIFCVILSYIVIVRFYFIRSISLCELCKNWVINPYRLRFFVLSSIAVAYLGIYIGNKMKEWICSFYKKMDLWDKKAYTIASFIGLGIIIFAYTGNENWFMQYDKVYSLDSGWCLQNIFSDPAYYDIRHPILSIFTFPLFAIVDTIVKFIFPGNMALTVNAIMLQFMNIQFLIIMAMLIKMITQNRMNFILYMVSFSTILYSVFFEKYPICVFFMVLYVYALYNKKENRSILALISAAGTMPTSCVLGIAEFFNSNKIKEKLWRVFKIVCITLCIFICLGRGHLLENGLDEMITRKENFSNKTLTVTEKCISVTKMIQSCFMALPSVVNGDVYWWDGLTQSFSIISIFIIAIMIIGVIKNWKDQFVKICASWNVFAFVLFMVLNWSTHESPLFILYFSWAIIPLFVMGMDYIVQKIKLNRNIIYGSIITIMVIINCVTILDIGKFLSIL